MQNYKEVCGNNKCIWFEINLNEGEIFLNWAKEIGCVWSNGKEILPEKGVRYLHFSIRDDGTLAYVDMIRWFADDANTENIKKYVFSEYIKGNKVKPNSKIIFTEGD